MKALIIDTCNVPMHIIGINEERISERVCNSVQRAYNSAIIPLVDEVVCELKMSIRDIDVVACVIGAGSFTGIRIGVMTGMALARGIGAKIIQLTEFEIMAYGITGRVLTAIDAGHGNYYTAEFDDGKLICMNNRDNEYLNNYDGVVKIYDGIIDKNYYVNVVKFKFEANEFCDRLAPLYLKDSQAEREKAEYERTNSK